MPKWKVKCPKCGYETKVETRGGFLLVPSGCEKCGNDVLMVERITPVSTVSCGVCGIVFKDDEDYEKHIFHYKGERWCGTKILRLIEADKKLAELIDKKRREAGWVK